LKTLLNKKLIVGYLGKESVLAISFVKDYKKNLYLKFLQVILGIIRK